MIVIMQKDKKKSEKCEMSFYGYFSFFTSVISFRPNANIYLVTCIYQFPFIQNGGKKDRRKKRTIE